MVKILTDGGHVSIVDPSKAVSPMMRYFNSPAGYRNRGKTKSFTKTEMKVERRAVIKEKSAPVQIPERTEAFDAVSSALEDSCMRKPVYADCWTVGRRDNLRIIESYSMPYGNVVIGIADDGEVEYNLLPSDYGYERMLTDAINGSIDSVRDRFRRKGGCMDRQSVMLAAGESLRKVHSDSDDVNWTIDDLCESVYRYTLGLGIFDILLRDDRIEDIYVDAPCEKNRIHITMNRIEGFNSHIRCRTNLIAEPREVKNLISRLKKDTGLPYCESSPVLESDLGDGSARVTIVGYPLSPNGDSVAIRKHSSTPWTLTRLIGNGTVSPYQAGMLSFLVANRSTFIIGGARGSGKSSLMSAMMFEFPLSQRILTIEDTMELPSRQMRDLGYKVQNMLIDGRMDGNARSRAEDALRVSLRLGESAIILGEVRGDEVSTLYQSMRTGKAGSSIMGTMHGDSAKSIYERVVHDMGITPEAFMATDFLLTMDADRARGSMKETRHLKEMVSTGESPGTFVDMEGEIMNSPAMRRIAATTAMNESDILEEVMTRAEMRSYISSIAERYGEEYYGPKWIVFANDYLAHQLDAGIRDRTEIIDGFKRSFDAIVGRE